MKKKNNRIKLKKSYRFLIIGIIILIITVFVIEYFDKKDKTKKLNEEKQIVDNITSHYNQFVKVINDSDVYKLDNGNYVKYGTLYNNFELKLEELNIDINTKYFYSKDLDIYINYNDVTPITELISYNNRYLKYVVFNKNVITRDSFTLYDGDKKVYTINNSMSFPIVINNYEDRYYVSFNNRLLSIKNDDVKKIVASDNTKNDNKSYVTTLCYHRVYDTSDECNDIYICKKKSSFDNEMKYLSDNNYLTLTMQEIYWYINGNIQVPSNTVMITFDDGYLFETAIDILEKYNLNGSGFIITSRFSDLSNLSSPNFELHSHTDAMHNAGECKGYGNQGGGILCLSEDKILNDLNASRKTLNNPIGLAYPFYDYNSRAIELLKKSGFKLAFIGANGVKGKGKPGINLYKIPRMTIYDTTTFNTWKSYL